MEPYFKAEWLSQEADSLVPVAKKKKKEKRLLSSLLICNMYMLLVLKNLEIIIKKENLAS